MLSCLASKQPRLWIACVFLVGGIFAFAAGNRYFEARVRPSLTASTPRLNFQLLDTEGNLFDSTKDLGPAGAIVYFLPEPISNEVQRQYSQLTRSREKLRGKQKELVMVSRWDVDNLRNMRRLANYDGPLLLDPSGSLLRKAGIDPLDRGPKAWVSIELGSQGHVIRAEVGKAPKEFGLE